MTRIAVVMCVLAGCLAPEGPEDEVQQAVTSCSATLAQPTTPVVWGAVIPLDVTAATCGGPTPQFQLFVKTGGGKFAMNGAATTNPSLAFDTSTSTAVAKQFYVGVRPLGTTQAFAQSNIVSVNVQDTVPACTSVKLTSPPNNAHVSVGTPIALTATAAGCNPEFQYWFRPSTAQNWTILDTTFTTGAGSFTPPATGTFIVTVVARDVGSHLGTGYSARGSSATLVAGANHSPVATDDTVSVLTNGAITFDPTANDSDADHDALTVVALGSPTLGSVSLSGNQVTYTSNGTPGVDTFTYDVSDGHTLPVTGTIHVSIASIAAADDHYSGLQNTTIAISPSVLANDTSLGGGGLTAINATLVDPSTGSLALAADGTGTFTPNPTVTGPVQLTYEADDGTSTSAPATVTIDVTPATPGCTVSIAGGSTDTFGTAMTITATAHCNTGVPEIEWLAQAPGTTHKTAVTAFSTATTFAFTPDKLGTWQVFATVRTQGTTTPTATSAALTVAVSDTNPRCTGTIHMTSPANNATFGFGQIASMSVSAATCPNPEYQFWLKPTTSQSWTVLTPFTPSATFGAWTVPPPGTYNITAVARTQGNHASYEIRANALTVTVFDSRHAITSFAIDSATGIIDEDGKTITVTSSATDATALVATFSAPGASVTVNGTPQISGTTANDFTSPVVYHVTAQDGETADYTVTVRIPDGHATLGIDGGTITLAGGPTITFPYGALASPTDISITANAQGGFDFEPKDLVLSLPATVTFPASPGQAAFWTIYKQPFDDTLSRTVANNTITARVAYLGSGRVGPDPGGPVRAMFTATYVFHDGDNLVFQTDDLDLLSPRVWVGGGNELSSNDSLTDISADGAVLSTLVGSDWYVQLDTDPGFGLPTLHHTDATAQAFSIDFGTRPDVVAASTTTTIEIGVTSMSPWQGATDSLLVYSPEVGAQWSTIDTSSVPDGATTLTVDITSDQADAGQANLVQASRGDTLVVVHVRKRSANNVDLSEHLELFSTAIDQTDGSFTTVSGAMTAANVQATNVEVTGLLAASGFDGTHSTLMNPQATPFDTAFDVRGRSVLHVDALADPLTIGDDVTVGVSWANATDESAAVLCELEVDGLQITARNATNPTGSFAFIDHFEPIRGPNTTCEPALLPPAHPTIAGRDAFQVQRAVGLSPMMAWDAQPTDQIYTTTLRHVFASGANTRASAALFIFSEQPFIQFPPGVLQDGEEYQIVTAADDAGRLGKILRDEAPGLAFTRAKFVSNLFSPDVTFKSFTSFSFPAVGAVGVIDEPSKTITVTVPVGTDVTSLVATFAIEGQDAAVQGAVQTSGHTANDFSGAVTYVVEAFDGSVAPYTVIVTGE